MRPDQFNYLTDSSVRALMIGALESGDNGWVNDLAMKMDSGDKTEDIAWVGTPPALQEFIAGRTMSELAEYAFTITQKDHGAGLRVPKRSWVHDKTGQLQIRFSQLADRVNDKPASMLSQLIMDAEATPCFDGQYFFHTAHSSKNSGTQDNDLGANAATATAPTAAEMTNAIMAAVQQIYGFKDDEGEPTNQMAKRFGIMVPTPFMRPALEATTSLLGTAGITNLIPSLQAKGMLQFEVIVNQRLTWTTKFAMFRLDGIGKPFVLMTDEMMNDVFALGPQSEYCKEHGHCLVGVDYSGNVQYGLWDQAVLTTFS